MARKRKLPVQRDKELKWIDSELEAAMEQLDGVNEKITELLQPFEKALASDAAQSEQTGAGGSE